MRKSDILDESDLDLAISYIMISIVKDLESTNPEIIDKLSVLKIESNKLDLDKEIPFFEMHFSFYLKDFLDIDGKRKLN